MILTEKIEIKTTNKNISHYRSMGYDIKSGDIIFIFPTELPFCSRILIDVQCDLCGKQSKIMYSSYRRNIENLNYYSCSKCGYEKSKITNTKKYGTEHPLQNETIKKKREETNIKKYNFKTPLQNENIKNKIKETTKNNYNVEYYWQSEESRKKWRENYEENKNEIENKKEETNIEKYGFKSPLQSDAIKEKIKETKKERYNNENYNNRELYKETCLERYGFENVMGDIDIQNKVKKTTFERFGVEFAAQNIKSFEKMMKSGLKIEKYKDTDLYYQGTFELDFLEKYYNKIEIGRGKPIKYQYKESEHIYFPDFYYEPLNLIIEIKSSKWYVENIEKNIQKQKSCREQGYNFIFIIDKEYEIFDKLINHLIYKENHCWQYDMKLNLMEEDLKKMNLEKKLNISDFIFEFVDSKDKTGCDDIKNFIEKYEWLGTMPNRPTHRFVAKYNGEIGGVIVMATPNSFSKILGENTKDIEKLISRGASASWTPKNLASSLIMWSIKWMVKNTNFRVFSAYSDPEAKELGTIYQACNFHYLGQKSGANKLYFDLNNSHIGWTTNRTFRKRMAYKRFSKQLNINWEKNWSNDTRVVWENIPDDIEKKLREYSKNYIDNCLVRKCKPKHKYVYILGCNKIETKKLINIFLERNKTYNYPKNRCDF